MRRDFFFTDNEQKKNLEEERGANLSAGRRSGFQGLVKIDG
jgi:hypothetical protein